MIKKFSFLLIPVTLTACGIFYSKNDQPKKIKYKDLGSKYGNIKHTSKLSAPFFIKITNDKEEVLKGDTFTLTGQISSRIPLKDLDIKWVLGDDLELVVGPLESKGDVSNDEPLEVSITLKQLSSINQKIHLIASSKVSGAHYSANKQYNSMDQELIKNHYKDLKRDYKRKYKK